MSSVDIINDFPSDLTVRKDRVKITSFNYNNLAAMVLGREGSSSYSLITIYNRAHPCVTHIQKRDMLAGHIHNLQYTKKSHTSVILLSRFVDSSFNPSNVLLVVLS